MANEHTAAALDFRCFMKELEDEGELIRIQKEVDPNLELGAITRRVYESKEKAPLFENLIGRRETEGLFRILGATFGLSKQKHQPLGRIAKALALPSNASGEDLMLKLAGLDELTPILPKVVEVGPVKNFKIFGDDIDFGKMPVPQLHQADGGKYIQTMGMHIVKTPDGKWTNWSITRGMTVGPRNLVCIVDTKQDIGFIWELWKQKGEDMPWALAFGVPPAATVLSGMPIPRWVDESGYVGALAGKAVDVIKCETNDLLVPANSEIVFEGTVSITETHTEGPFGEYHGYEFPQMTESWPLFQINAITYQANPVIPACVAGRAAEETQTIWGLAVAAQALIICRQAGLPIRMAWCPPEAQVAWLVLQVDRPRLLSLRTNASELCTKIASVVFPTKVGGFIPKILVVGDDVDPTNLNDIIWVEATRCEPGKQEFIFPHSFPTYKLVPFVSQRDPEDKSVTGKTVRCCMLPEEFTDAELQFQEVSFRGSYPDHVKNKVLQNWAAYGFSE